MPILKVIGKNKKKNNNTQTPASLKRVLEYITRKGKNEDEVYKCFGVGVNDNIDKVFKQIMFNKDTHDKRTGKQYKHYVKSYPKGFNNLEIIEKITREFVEKKFLEKGFMCYVAIHQDKDHYHSHIIVDTVNFKTGYKLHELNSKDMEKTRYKNKILPEHEIILEDLKTSMEEIAMSYGVESPEHNKEKNTINIGNMAKYKGLTNENSWRTRIAEAFQEVVLNVTTTTENLQDRLKEKGIYFNRFNKEKKTLTLATQYQDNKGVSKKGLVKLNKLEAEEDYRFKVTKNIYNWENLFEELESHKVKMLEQEKEIIKEDKEIGNFMDILQEKILEYDKEVEKDKEIKKEKEKSYSYSYSYEDYTPSKKSNTEKEYIPPVAPVKSVEKKEEEKPKVVELNAIEKAKISQQIAEEQRLKELRAEELAKKKKKATEWIDDKDQWVDEKDEWVSEWEDDKNDWDLSK